MYYRPKRINWDLVPLGSRPDTAFAKELGVASQVVQTARARRGIPAFRTQEALLASKIDWDSIPLGECPDSVLARELRVSRRRVCAERRRRRIPAFVGLLLTQEGEPCRSIYEAMYDACLHDQGTPHEHEVRIPGMTYIADFKVGGEYIEIVGMSGFGRYSAKHAMKRRAYETASVVVQWLYPADVEALFADCRLPLRFRTTRRCLECAKETNDLVKGVCRRCYMHRWHASTAKPRSCDECGDEFAARGSQRFCSHSCYARSLELPWPAWDELERRLATTSIRKVALDLGLKPNTLYMRLHRRRANDKCRDRFA